jgi:hypothetical protein
MKLFCRGNHWAVVNKQLILETPQGQEILKQMIKALDTETRRDVYNEVIAIPLLSDRKRITKNGIDNVALTVQDIIANYIIRGEINDNAN